MGQFPFRLGGANSCVVPELLTLVVRVSRDDASHDEHKCHVLPCGAVWFPRNFLVLKLAFASKRGQE